MKKKVRNLIIVVFLLTILIVAFVYRADITRFIVKTYFIDYNIIINEPNEYSKGINYLGFQQTDDFIPGNKEELKNIFYTVLDKGWTSFTFYFEDKYTSYFNDVEEMTNDGTFASMNNFIHPFNSYKSINFNVNEYGIATITIIKNYTYDEIAIIDLKIDKIMEEIINDDMSTIQKIKVFHDYIINNTVYDTEEAKLVEQNKSKNPLSYKAFNVVVNGIGLCGGYTDTLAIFLSKIGINNFKVGVNNHIWNALLVNNTWSHIDMTWDDPVTNDNTPMLIYDYFMIDSQKLKKLDKEKHNFNSDLYLEVK